MGMSTNQITLLVIAVIAILTIVYCSWNLVELQKLKGDDCHCSGVTTSEIRTNRTTTIVMLSISIAALFYAILMLMWPGPKATISHETKVSHEAQIGERFTSRSI